jgi:Domain of unknown function (DUF4276)
MKVLLVGEGAHERSGALEAFVRRLAKAPVECDSAPVSRDDIHTHRGKGQGFFKRAVRWLLEGRKRGYDAVVLVVDEDGHPKRIDEVDRAQDEMSITDLPRALGVAVRTFDAWMLADEQALTKVLGQSVARQRSPESIKDPKQICKSLHDDAGADISPREMYAAIAQVADVATLRQRCPKGFAPFAGRVESLK